MLLVKWLLLKRHVVKVTKTFIKPCDKTYTHNHYIHERLLTYIAQRSNKRNSPFLPLKSAKIWRYIINFAQMFLYSRSKPTKKLLEWGPILNIQLHQIFHFLFPLWLHFFPNTQIPSEYQTLLSLLLVLLEVKSGQSIDFWTFTFFNSFDLV